MQLFALNCCCMGVGTGKEWVYNLQLIHRIESLPVSGINSSTLQFIQFNTAVLFHFFSSQTTSLFTVWFVQFNPTIMFHFCFNQPTNLHPVYFVQFSFVFLFYELTCIQPRASRSIESLSFFLTTHSESVQFVHCRKEVPDCNDATGGLIVLLKQHGMIQTVVKQQMD